MVVVVFLLAVGAERPRIFVTPHSHCDVGWLNTPASYQARNVSGILSSVVQLLVEEEHALVEAAEVVHEEVPMDLKPK